MKYFALVSTLHYLTVFFSTTLLVSTSNINYTPFAYPRLYQIVDKRAGMEYFCKKLGVDGFFSDYLILKRAKPYRDWKKEADVLRETIRNIDACALLKTEPRSRAFDAVGIKGDRECLKQCQLESKMYYEHLNSKLQKLINVKSFPTVEVRLAQGPVGDSDMKKYHKCVKKGYKRFVCQCSYPEYVIEATEEFKKTFQKIVRDLYGLTPSPDNLKMVEERHRTPLKLVAFLITCHLLPTEMLSFLVWWDVIENPSSYPVIRTTTPTLELSSEECETIAETEESEGRRIGDSRLEESEEETDDEEEEEEE